MPTPMTEKYPVYVTKVEASTNARGRVDVFLNNLPGGSGEVKVSFVEDVNAAPRVGDRLLLYLEREETTR